MLGIHRKRLNVLLLQKDEVTYDFSKLDKIMDTYRENKKTILVSIGLIILVVPALISGVIEGFNDAIDTNTQDAINFSKDLAKDVENGKVDPQTAASYGAAYTSVAKDIIDDEKFDLQDAIDAINKIQREQGKQ